MTSGGYISNIHQVANGSGQVDIWAQYRIRSMFENRFRQMFETPTSGGRALFRLLIQKSRFPILSALWIFQAKRLTYIWHSCMGLACVACKYHARTPFMQPDKRKMDWPQYVVVVGFSSLIQESEGSFRYVRHITTFRWGWFFWIFSIYYRFFNEKAHHNIWYCPTGFSFRCCQELFPGKCERYIRQLCEILGNVIRKDGALTFRYQGHRKLIDYKCMRHSGFWEILIRNASMNTADYIVVQ